jgi:hypothetical protein
MMKIVVVTGYHKYVRCEWYIRNEYEMNRGFKIEGQNMEYLLKRNTQKMINIYSLVDIFNVKLDLGVIVQYLWYDGAYFDSW